MTTHSFAIIGGYLYIITSLVDKIGGSWRLDQDSDTLLDIERNQHLIDVKLIDRNYTWSINRSGSQHITCHFDRFLVSKSLYMSGVDLETNILPTHGSDH